MAIDVDLQKDTRLPQGPEVKWIGSDNGDEVSNTDEMNNTVPKQELEEIESVVKGTIEKPDGTDLKKLLEDILSNQSKNEAERKSTADGLVSVYYSVVLKFEWLGRDFAKTGVVTRWAGRRHKKLLEESAIALKKEVLDLLRQFGIRVFCDTGFFDGRLHTIAKTKPTNRKELDRQIARVVRDGFVQQRREGLVCFRSQIVDVYKYVG
jgi:hypothetical protein